MNYSQIVSFIWGVADLIRDTFKRGKYQDVILPLTVLRRLDCVLAPTKAEVLQRQAELRERGLEDLRPQLCAASGFAFYNTSQYDFARLLGDAPNVAANLRNYIAGFSPNMRDVLERFGPGLPRISDGQTLFLLHMLAHAKDTAQGGSRIAIIMNGSPLFTGDAGSGENEIRRYVFEHDLLEALIALPEQLFYNTGIATYVWLLTNRKAAARQGKVQLIDATSFWAPMRRSLGDKRREIPPERAADILTLLRDFRDGDTRVVTEDGKTSEAVVSRIFPTTHFGFRRITVERPLRLNFAATPERVARIEAERGFQALAKSRKRGDAAVREVAEGRNLQEAIRTLLHGLPQTTVTDRKVFETQLATAAKQAGLKLSAPVKKAVLNALSERDETAAICRRGRGGQPEPDPALRDTERVPLTESVASFFEREVQPHVPDAWVDESKRDQRDGQVGIVGYEINFNRYFYRYEPPRPLPEIEADIRAIQSDIVRMLSAVTGVGSR